VGQQTQLSYSSAGLLDTVESPTGARTVVDYDTPLPDDEPGLVVVKSVRVTDANDSDVLARRDFTIDPQDNPQHHNYTGYPDFDTGSGDGLFDSGNTDYRYSTELSDGTSTVRSTYNSLHLLTSREVFAPQRGEGSRAQAQLQEFTYPLSNASSWSPDNLPANYSKPTATKLTYGDPIFGSTRSVQTSSDYDDHGQLVSSTKPDGTVTTTKFDYDHYGLPKTQTVTGTDGTTSITTNDLTADGKAIATTTTAVGASGQTPTARTVTSYGYDDTGELTDRSRAWAAGAKPPGPSGGPDQLDESRTVTVDTNAHIRTD
jgi:YD repeat-containing protein